MPKYDPNIVANLAASLLRNRDLDVGAHHARDAVRAARTILDEAYAAAEGPETAAGAIAA